MWFEIPEEIRKKMEEQFSRAEMAAESYRHDSTRLFQELDIDQLRIFRHMLHNLVMDTEGNLAAYYEGMAASVLQFKFNVCPSCGVNHDEEAHQFDGNNEGEGISTESVDANVAFQQAADNLQAMLPTFNNSPEDMANMEKYHLDDMRDQDNGQILGYLCTGVNGTPCGMVYPSIEDRMLREPDSCTGCQQRAAWG